MATQMHYVISRLDQPDAGMWLVSIPLCEAKSGDNSIFTNQMVAIHMETRSKEEATAFLKTTNGNSAE